MTFVKTTSSHLDDRRLDSVASALVREFHWVLYFFGVVLIATAIKLAFQKDRKVDPSRNPVLRFFRKILPFTDEISEGGFFVRREGRLYATPLLAVLIAIETADVVFAVDSIPAVFALLP